MAAHEWGIFVGYRITEQQARLRADGQEEPVILGPETLAFISEPGCLKCGAPYDRGNDDCDTGS
jgi:hypothetical protein